MLERQTEKQLIVESPEQFLSKELRKKFGSIIQNIILFCIIQNIILFGSRARGDFYEGSDYDFLIVLKYKDQKVIKEIREIEVAFLDKYDKLAASLIFTEDEWKERLNFSIAKNIQRDGIIL